MSLLMPTSSLEIEKSDIGWDLNRPRIYQLWAYRLFSLFETVSRFIKGNFIKHFEFNSYLMVMVL